MQDERRVAYGGRRAGRNTAMLREFMRVREEMPAEYRMMICSIHGEREVTKGEFTEVKPLALPPAERRDNTPTEAGEGKNG